MVCQNQSALGGKVEEGGSNGSALSHAGLARTSETRYVVDGAEGHGAVVGAIVVGSIDEVLAVDRGSGEVLDRSPAALGLCEDVAGSPRVGGGQSTRLSGDVRESSGVGHCQQCGAGQQRFLGLLRSHDGKVKEGLVVVKEWNDAGQTKPSSGQGMSVISMRGILLVSERPSGRRQSLNCS